MNWSVVTRKTIQALSSVKPALFPPLKIAPCACAAADGIERVVHTRLVLDFWWLLLDEVVGQSAKSRLCGFVAYCSVLVLALTALWVPEAEIPLRFHWIITGCTGITFVSLNNSM